MLLANEDKRLQSNPLDASARARYNDIKRAMSLAHQSDTKQTKVL